MLLKLFTKILSLVLLLFAIVSNAQIGNIDSLKIIPANPNTGSVVKVIGFTTFSSAGCSISSSSVNIAGNLITVRANHSVGMLTMICHSKDTITLGTFAAGVYTVNYSVYNANSTSSLTPLDNTSTTFTIQALSGIHENQSTGNNVIVFPNPAADFVIISQITKSKMPVKVEVLNITGKIIGSYVFDDGQFNIDLKSFVPGIYFMKINNDETGVVSKKLIVAR